jgi:hypothetical protein
MRFTPTGVHRQAVGDARPAEWYVIWLGRPGAEGSIIIGRTKRLRRHLYHRAFSVYPDVLPDEFKGHTAALEWLLEVHRKRAD